MSKKHTTKRTMRIEQLQSRELMAADFFGGGSLFDRFDQSTEATIEDLGYRVDVVGTNLNDQVLINEVGDELSIVVITRDANGDYVSSVSERVDTDNHPLISIEAKGGNDVVRNNTSEYAYVQAGSGDDTLHGGDGFDTFYGGPGNDLLYGNGGRDTLDGDTGNDRIYGGDENDTLRGGLGDDRLFGQDGGDLIYGDEYNETSKDGDDRIYGGDNNDTIYGGGGDDTISGGLSNDLIRGGSGNDWLFGNDGHDIMYGKGGTDNLYGGNGNDYLDGGDGAVDQLWGNQDRDTFVRHKHVFSSNDGDVFNDKTNIDEVISKWHA